MPIPLIYPLLIGGVAAGAALQAWLGATEDAWDDKNTFNARVAEMHGFALALNNGLAGCQAFMSHPAQLAAWRNVRDGFGKWYSEVGTLTTFDPSDSEIAQAKDYASKFYFWNTEYERLKCGDHISGAGGKDPYAQNDPIPSQTDWAPIIKWAAIGIGLAYAGKIVTDLLPNRQK